MPMKQLLILSGKGGTGKTTVASAFVKLSQAQAFADCDVDAPNLHLVTTCTAAPEKEDYFGLFYLWRHCSWLPGNFLKNI